VFRLVRRNRGNRRIADGACFYSPLATILRNAKRNCFRKSVRAAPEDGRHAWGAPEFPPGGRQVRLRRSRSCLCHVHLQDAAPFRHYAATFDANSVQPKQQHAGSLACRETPRVIHCPGNDFMAPVWRAIYDQVPESFILCRSLSRKIVPRKRGKAFLLSPHRNIAYGDRRNYHFPSSGRNHVVKRTTTVRRLGGQDSLCPPTAVIPIICEAEPQKSRATSDSTGVPLKTRQYRLETTATATVGSEASEGTKFRLKGNLLIRGQPEEA